MLEFRYELVTEASGNRCVSHTKKIKKRIKMNERMSV